jgi:hypothetical protein
MTGVMAHVLTLGTIPDPMNPGGQGIFRRRHDRCYRRPFYDRASS